MARRDPYARTETPKIVYEGEFGGFECFRLKSREAEKLNGLLYKGEIIEFLSKNGVEHRIGSSVRGFELPSNPGHKDVFILVHFADVMTFTDAFPVYGFSPAMLV